MRSLIKAKVVFIILTMILAACGQQSTTTTKKISLKQRKLEQAVFFAESNLGSLGDVGYVQWTPKTAADELVKTMNASQILTPEEKEEYRQNKVRIPKAIPYVLNQPTETWQVVIVADEVGEKILNLRQLKRSLCI